MITAPGGISKVEFAATNSFPGTELPGVMKESKIEPMTPTEDNGLGKPVGAGKGFKGSIICEDLTDTPWATLRGYETAQTEFFLKIYMMKTAQSLVLKSVQGIVELVPAEQGKNWKRKLDFTGFADTEANVATLTLS